MTPVEMVQEWLTAIGGETEYDAEHRERLLWEELRELQAAMDDYHHSCYEAKIPERHRQVAAMNIARELCDVAYVAIGNALLRGDDLRGYNLRPVETIAETRAAIEQMLYDLFRDDEGSDSCYPIREAATYYGVGDKIEACFAEVHRANMAKLKPCIVCGSEGVERVGSISTTLWRECVRCNGLGRIVNRDSAGRILKPAGWQPPELGKILFGEMGDKTNG